MKNKSSETTKYKQDFRKSHPALHLFYVKWAVASLVAIDRAIKRFEKLGVISLNEATFALIKARDTLVKEDAAFADANEILQIAKTGNKSLAT